MNGVFQTVATRMQFITIILFPLLVFFMGGASGLAGESPATYVVAKLPQTGRNGSNFACMLRGVLYFLFEIIDPPLQIRPILDDFDAFPNLTFIL